VTAGATFPETDAVALTAELVRCRSVTPADDGAIAVLERCLAQGGFRTWRADRGGIANLVARWGDTGPVFGFNGHTDVVPPGPLDRWSVDPFAATIRDGMLIGRGAADMKSGVAAFVAAALDHAAEGAGGGSILITVTGDEEAEAAHGTVAILDWMRGNGQRMDMCLVGEPTSPEVLGQMMKIGRRGSLSARIIARGAQGHAAYPQRARNPLSGLVRLLDRLASHRLDQGTSHFEPSTLALTTIDTGNPAGNVIPGSASASLNIRFNDAHTAASLERWLSDECARAAAETGIDFDLAVRVSGDSFVTEPGPLTNLVANAVRAETGLQPELSTSGGTSDARFIKDHCPVVEFGLVGRTIHQADEQVAVADIRRLKAIYRRILRSCLG
jgi:succinyl-diaminopimelate desuccinylase